MPSRFRHIFNKYPLIANSVIYGSFYTTAELSQQIVTKKIQVSFNNLRNRLFIRIIIHSNRIRRSRRKILIRWR